MENELVVIIMPVFNAESTLEESVNSLLNQTWSNLRLVIVNDGSTDDSRTILDNLARKDSRLLIIHRATNMGPGPAANTALTSSVCNDADFIARADADDINDPMRIAEQVKFMNANPDIDVCGTSVTVDGRVIMMPSDPCLTRFHMLLYCSLANPSIMCRSSALRLRYSIARSHRVCEDYRLWLDLLLVRKQFVNIPGPPLVHLKRTKSCLSVKSAEEQRYSAIEAARDAISAVVGDHGLTLQQIEHCREPALIRTSAQAHKAYELISSMRSASVCQCLSTCESVEDELTKRLGEIAVISMQLGDMELFQKWLRVSPMSTVDYLRKLPIIKQ